MQKGAANTVLEDANSSGGLEMVNEDPRIVDQVQAEDALQHEMDFAESIVMTAQAIVLVLDTKGRIIRFNPYMEEISGYRMEEVQGKDWFTTFLPRRDQSRMRALFLTAVGDIKTRGNVNSIVTKDGHEREIEWHDKTLKDSDDNVVGLLSIGQDITEHKAAEDSLRESEQMLREAQKIARIGRWDLDLISNRLHWSDSIFELFEIDPRKFKASYEAFLDGIHPADRDKVDLAYTESLKTKLPYEISHRLLMKDGRIKWVHEMCRTEYDSQGQALRSVGIVQDITERKHAVDEINKFKTIADLANYGSAIADMEGNLEYVNSYFAQIHGYTSNELTGQNLSVFHNEKQLEAVRQINESLKENGNYGPMEVWHTHKDGTEFPMLMTGMIITDESGNSRYLATTAIDITERKKAENALRESENRLNIIFESAPDAYYINDFEGVFIEGNNAAEELVGYSREELIGKNFVDAGLLSMDEVEKAVKRLAEDTNGKSTGPEEFTLKRKDGTKVNVEILNHPVKIGGEDRVLGIARDITERKHAEEALRQSEQDLRLRNQINNIVLSYPDEEMYAEILKLIRKATESKYGTFGYFDENGSFVAPAVTRKIYWDKCNVPDKNIIFEKGTFGGIWGRAIKERTTLISNDGPFTTPKGHIHIENTMVTPIIFHDEVISVIHIADKPNGYDEQDRVVLETIADQIAPVLYARLQRDRKDVQRKHAEEEIRLHAAMMDNVAEGVYLIGLDDLIIKWTNEKFERMFGYDPGEMVGKQVDIVNAPTESTPTETRISIVDVLKETGEWHGEVKNIKRDGTHFWCSANVSLFDHPEYGKVILSVHTDITEHKHAEEELQKRMNELETFYRATLGREDRVIELKQEVNQLLEQLGEKKKYRDYS